MSIDKLTDEFRQTVRILLDECEAKGVVMKPFFTIRDPWEQAKLWRQSRSTQEIYDELHSLRHAGALFLADCIDEVGPQYGNPVTNAIPGMSWHQWGEAVDCYWQQAGRANWAAPQDEISEQAARSNGYYIYANLAANLQLTAGGHWRTIKDWPHVQYRNRSPDDYYSLQQINDRMRAWYA